MIAPTPFFSDRGCHIRIYEEIRTLQELGHNITLCTYHLGNNIAGINIKRIINIPWYNKIDAGPSWHKIYLDLLLFLKAFKVSYQDNFDIIHAHLHEGVFIGKAIKILHFNKIPLIFDSQGGLLSELKSHNFVKEKGIIKKMICFLEKKSYKIADKVIASSNYLKNDKVQVITDSTNQEFKVTRNELENLKQSLGLSNKKIVVYSGGIKKCKGIDSIFEAAIKVIPKIANIVFLIIGYGDLKKYKELANNLKISSHFLFTDRINYFDLPKYLKIADLAIDPKHDSTEASGKIINYMRAGLPIIAYDNNFNKKVLGKKGIYINNSSELSSRILDFFSDNSPNQIHTSTKNSYTEISSIYYNIKNDKNHSKS